MGRRALAKGYIGRQSRPYLIHTIDLGTDAEPAPTEIYLRRPVLSEVDFLINEGVEGDSDAAKAARRDMLMQVIRLIELRDADAPAAEYGALDADGIRADGFEPFWVEGEDDPNACDPLAVLVGFDINVIEVMPKAMGFWGFNRLGNEPPRSRKGKKSAAS